jgi:K+-transporting ATPase c subunit
MIIAAGIAYPLLLVLVGSIKLPFQSTGSILTLDGQVVGSNLLLKNLNLKSFSIFDLPPIQHLQ